MQKKPVIAGLTILFCFALTAGLIYGFQRAPGVPALPRSASDNTTSDQSGDEWPMFRGGLYRNGTVTTTATSSSGIMWKYLTDATNGVTTSPAVAGGRVFVSSGGSLFCLDAATGGYLWKNTTVSGGSSPAVAGDYVYVSKFRTIYCLDANNGHQVWQVTSRNYIGGSPAVVEGIVYFGTTSYSGQPTDLIALHANDGSVHWNQSAFGTNGFISSPAIAGANLYIGDDVNTLYCRNTIDGTAHWSYITTAMMTSTPCVYGASVYISAAGNLTCLSASLSKIWTKDVGGIEYSSPVVSGGKVYVGSRDYSVYCLNTGTGDLAWKYPTGDEIWSSPAIAGGKLYICSNDKNLYCLDATTGVLAWKYATIDSLMYASPAIAGGKVFLGSGHADNNVYCLPMTLTSPGGGDGVPAYPLWAVILAGGIAICVILRKKGFLVTR